MSYITLAKNYQIVDCAAYIRNNVAPTSMTKAQVDECIALTCDKPRDTVDARHHFFWSACCKGYYCPKGKTCDSYGKKTSTIAGLDTSGLLQYWWIPALAISGIIVYKIIKKRG